MSKLTETKLPLRIHVGRTESWCLQKLSDDRFKGNHPNGIDEGVVLTDVTEYDKPVVGERPYFISYDRWIVTSVVTDILSEQDNEIIFKTWNSTYKFFKKN